MTYAGLTDSEFKEFDRNVQSFTGPCTNEFCAAYYTARSLSLLAKIT